jgi:hypothetical protein
MPRKPKTRNLTKEPPRSPRHRLGEYVILARAIDKCRAEIAGQLGEYHYDCPLDNILFCFKGLKGVDLKKEVEKGLSDQDLLKWADVSGTPKTPEEIKRWSDETEAVTLVNHPEKKGWFIGECKRLGLDPQKATLFDMLDADDRASFK